MKELIIKFEGLFFEPFKGQIRFSGTCVYENKKINLHLTNGLGHHEYFDVNHTAPTCLQYTDGEECRKDIQRQKYMISDFVHEFFSENRNTELHVGGIRLIKKDDIKIHLLLTEISLVIKADKS